MLTQLTCLIIFNMIFMRQFTVEYYRFFIFLSFSLILFHSRHSNHDRLMLFYDTKGSSRPLYHLYENTIGFTELFNFLRINNVIEFIVYMSIANLSIISQTNPYFGGKFVDLWIDSKSQV
jgi:hypothetical protein